MGNPSSRAGAILIRKRDGGLEPFDPAKLRGSIRQALLSAGEPSGLDNAVANGLAEAIHEYVDKGSCRAAVPSRQILELVEMVLAQTGHDEASMAIRQHADVRDRQRRWQLVAERTAPDGRLVQRRWNKARLVRHLQREHLLDAPASRMIAGRVEQLVLGCGLKVVTAELVREMANSELLAWGLLPGALAGAAPRRRRQMHGEKIRDRTESSEK